MGACRIINCSHNFIPVYNCCCKRYCYCRNKSCKRNDLDDANTFINYSYLCWIKRRSWNGRCSYNRRSCLYCSFYGGRFYYGFENRLLAWFISLQTGKMEIPRRACFSFYSGICNNDFK